MSVEQLNDGGKPSSFNYKNLSEVLMGSPYVRDREHSGDNKKLYCSVHKFLHSCSRCNYDTAMRCIRV